jgi:hypothetical protein
MVFPSIRMTGAVPDIMESTSNMSSATCVFRRNLCNRLGKLVYLNHLLHLQSQCCSGGIKFYTNIKFYDSLWLMVDSGNAEHADLFIILLTDSSLQEFPDTSRSRDGYFTCKEGGVIDAVMERCGVGPRPMGLK